MKLALMVPIMAVVFLSWTAPPGRAGEPDPGDLVSMLDHVAIVETIAQECESSRPDLAARFREAKQNWWTRNSQIHDALVSLEQEIGLPRAKAFLEYFSSLQRARQSEVTHRSYVSLSSTPFDGILSQVS